ncbi:MAG: cytochrome b/b6 domain-containing protein [Campylobacter sp.]|nr:cytochrome b/b6 domain-containing protein [Campylobacter sp.]
MIYFIKKTYGKIEILGTMGDFHGILANLIFAVVVCHILGVIFEKLRGGDAINSMLNGKKKKAKFDAIVPRFWVGFFVLSYILAACAFVYFI